MTQAQIRCAIYTRKSTDEGLEQDFNSLDAQYEAAVAYIASQRHEGWTLVRDRFDDGGVSGGTLERPALQRLLAEVEAGRIRMIVVYKIDRLTRSLADFAKLIERLEAKACSFVSVTQSFNTATSMGRLTLNMLLSFAQFEREVTAERIRDKIAASKKKGLWMGGVPPLGYDGPADPKRRVLEVNTTEAVVVRKLFELCNQFGSLRAVEREADRLGLRSKRHHFRSGRIQGGNALTRGMIHKILVNPVYLGLIRHGDQTYPGLHAPIVDRDLWDQVQTKLKEASAKPRGRGNGTPGKAPPPLLGKLRDQTGDRLTPTHAQRGGRRFRYYISNRLVSGGTDASGWRLPAPALEVAIGALLATHISDAVSGHRLLAAPDLRADAVPAEIVRDLVRRLHRADAEPLRALLREGTIRPGRVTLALDTSVLAAALGLDEADLAPELQTISAEFRLRRRGIEAKLIVGTPSARPDPVLLKALAEAHVWMQSLRDGTTLREIARNDAVDEAQVRKRGQLAFLSPKIQSAILNGTHPCDLSLARLIQTPPPLDWNDQERLYGF